MVTHFTPTQLAQWAKENLGVDPPMGCPNETCLGYAAVARLEMKFVALCRGTDNQSKTVSERKIYRQTTKILSCQRRKLILFFRSKGIF